MAVKHSAIESTLEKGKYFSGSYNVLVWISYAVFCLEIIRILSVLLLFVLGLIYAVYSLILLLVLCICAVLSVCA